jgi:DNA-binding GntR family transcriptional regulator
MCFERLRYDERGPLALLTSYLSDRVIEVVSREELLVDPPLVLLPKKGLSLRGADQAVSAKPANQHEAKWLNLEAGAPLLCTARTIYAADSSPVTHMVARLRYDRYELRYSLDDENPLASIPAVWRI